MSDESQESLGSKIVGRVAFVYRNEYAEGGWKAYGIDADSGIDVGYKRYDIVLKTGVGLKTPGLYHCIRTISKSECKAWETLCADGYVAGEGENVTDKTAFVLYLPMTDVYTFLKEHLKADNTIDITFYDEDLKDDDHPNGYNQSDADYHNIKFNVNASALTFDSGTVSVDTFSPKSDINKGYDLTGKSVIDVVKELLCPYVLPTLKWTTTPTDVWAGFGGTVTWTVQYEKGSNVKPYGWWDTVAAADREQISDKSPQSITTSITIPTTAALGVYATHKYSVKDVGDNPKYEVVSVDEKSVSVKQPCFYWYSTTDDSNITSVSTARAKKAAAKSTIESGRVITQAESGVLNWWYLVPTGTAINGFVQTDGVTPNSSKKVKSNIPIKIMNGTTECLTVYCDLWRSGQELTVNAKFTNICK